MRNKNDKKQKDAKTNKAKRWKKDEGNGWNNNVIRWKRKFQKKKEKETNQMVEKMQKKGKKKQQKYEKQSKAKTWK